MAKLDAKDAVHMLAAAVALCLGGQWCGICEQQVQVHFASLVLSSCPSGLGAALCIALCLSCTQLYFADLCCTAL